MRFEFRSALMLAAAVCSACTDHAPTSPSIRGSQTASSSVTVTSANPNTAPQDTTINSHVYGSGFDRGSKAQWAQNGVPSPDVKTNSTQYVSSTELIANISIASIATAGSYDIAVTTSNGIKGIGSELFIVSARPVASVAVNPTSANMAVSSSLGFTATTYDKAGKVLTGRFVSWASSDVSVATVSASGLVTALAPGSATIIATSEGVSGTAAVSVIAIPTGTLAFTSLNLGSVHSCALTSTGTAYCWGYNANGQLGNGSTADSPVPVAVAGNLSFSAISPGYWATCGIATGSAAYCWGQNVSGLFGDGTGNNSLTPVPAASGLSVAVLSQGDQHTCGLSGPGTPYCWGWNHYGQIGNSSTTDSPVPVAVSGGLAFSTIGTSGPADHSCGLTGSGAAYCWGLNSAGQIGGPTSALCKLPLSKTATVSCAIVPVAVAGGLNFVAASAGYSHTCGVTAGGAAYCWGDNSAGELGDGTTTNRSSPVAVAGGLTFSAISAGTRFSCGLASSGAVYCWGENKNGQLGDGTNSARANPTAVSGGISFSIVKAGSHHVCGISTTGTAYCWGANLHSQLGNGASADSYSPVKVADQP